jgi:hypothetical protein
MHLKKSDIAAGLYNHPEGPDRQLDANDADSTTAGCARAQAAYL